MDSRGSAVERVRDWLGSRFLVLAAAALTTMAVTELIVDGTGSANPALIVVVAGWIGTAFLSQAWRPELGAIAVAAFYPIGAAMGLAGFTGAGLVAVLLAAGHVGASVGRRRSLATVATMMVVVVATDLVVHGLTWEIIFLPLALLPARWAGRLVRSERRRSSELAALNQQLAEQREAAELAAVAAERARIAREVHDSVAHAVSVMTLQVGGLRRQLSPLLQDRPHEVEVLLGLERLGRQTVDELRGLVGLLRQPDGADRASDALPSLEQAQDVIDDVRAAGLEVEYTVEGAAHRLPRAVDQSALRILQEALTNALRHAPGCRTVVTVQYRTDAVALTVTSHGTTSARRSGGHGLLTMRERALMFGGTLDVEQSADSFRVSARLPLPVDRLVPLPSATA